MFPPSPSSIFHSNLALFLPLSPSTIHTSLPPSPLPSTPSSILHLLLTT
ncbi:hypothetical protein E2C01_066818 [Portunus trituberculatus]|uniref:Uncharacterized protein n=1 Tax=Portunus trituberculatus TaxID=210409 RepID=A0A5B7HRX0_PORTR|nr:hypothetical protein [Portunus trituberculatus]